MFKERYLYDRIIKKVILYTWWYGYLLFFQQLMHDKQLIITFFFFACSGIGMQLGIEEDNNGAGSIFYVV
jgi:hypothetical protein